MYLSAAMPPFFTQKFENRYFLLLSFAIVLIVTIGVHI